VKGQDEDTVSRPAEIGQGIGDTHGPVNHCKNHWRQRSGLQGDQDQGVHNEHPKQLQGG
jgi:hypothetical protein